MEFTILKPSFAEGILVVTISRPSALNALNTLFFEEFNALLDEYQDRPELKVVVITGEGKAFVAGADIAEMVHKNQQEGYEFSRIGQKLFDRIEALPLPVIGAINGFCLGGGNELAMSCDFRVASKLAKFGQPEVNLGLIPGYAATQRLSRFCGMSNALYLLMTAETITADDALRIGLVQKVVEPEALIEEVMKMASKIAANGSKAIRKVKEITREGINLEFSEACELEAEAFGELFGEPTTKEGMTAFLEKRKPNW
jgi:enoyl-CoA hydratase